MVLTLNEFQYKNWTIFNEQNNKQSAIQHMLNILCSCNASC